MRIRFQPEGGFAHFPGLSRPVVIDTAALSAAERGALEGLLRAARFFSLPAAVGGAPGAADHRTYVLEVEDGGLSHTVRAADPVGDPALQALIDALNARPR